MKSTVASDLKCVNCGRTIESCACCDERDCPEPTCDRDRYEAILKSTRPQFVHRGASIVPED